MDSTSQQAIEKTSRKVSEVFPEVKLSKSLMDLTVWTYRHSDDDPYKTFVPRVDPTFVFDVGVLEALILGESLGRHVYLWGQTGSGKCHRKGQGILLADGTIRKVEDILPGDRLASPDSKTENPTQYAAVSKARTVKSVNVGEGQMYRIVPVKGNPFVVNDEHVLTLVRTGSGNTVDVPVKMWLTWSSTKKRMFKLFREAVDFTRPPDKLRERRALSPYLLGVLLGDGGLGLGCYTLTSGDSEIVKHVRFALRRLGLALREQRVAGKAITYSISRTKSRPIRKGIGPHVGNPLGVMLKKLGLRGARAGEKFIPQEFKIAPRSVRLQILAGLMDTDGHMQGGGFDFISKSERLANDVAFISRSVGLAAYVKPCEKRCQTGGGGTYFRVGISGDCSVVPCRVSRKRAPRRAQQKSVLRTGFTVEKLGIEKFYGFTLDGDGRYFLDDFMVTHNSQSVIQFCARRGKEVIRQNFDEHSARAEMIGAFMASANPSGTGLQFRFRRGTLALSILRPATYLADEYDVGTPSATILINPILESEDPILHIPETEELIRPNKDWRCVATGNTDGINPDPRGIYAGTQIQNFASLSRFAFRVQVAYCSLDKEREILKKKFGKLFEKDAGRLLVENLLNFVKEYRAAYDATTSLTVPFSTRMIHHTVEAIIFTGSVKRALGLTLLPSLPPTEKNVVESLMVRLKVV